MAARCQDCDALSLFLFLSPLQTGEDDGEGAGGTAAEWMKEDFLMGSGMKKWSGKEVRRAASPRNATASPTRLPQLTSHPHIDPVPGGQEEEAA